MLTDRPQVESENAALALRCFRIVGTIVFLFQFLFLVADRFVMPEYQKIFLPLYAINGIDAACAVLVTRTRWFPHYWKLLGLILVGLLDLTGTIMNIFSGTVTPQFYLIITFSIGCATFLPWGVIWQSVLNLLCLASYVLVCLYASVTERFLYYQWITLLAVLLLSEFPAAFIDQYRRRLFNQLEELSRAHEELTRALKASQDKSEFLASMSHEMRTPLNTIIGMTEVLEGTEVTPEQSQYLNLCHASGDALVSLINDIVDISRVEAGELHLDHVAFDLYELMDHLADSLALRAHRKDLELIFDVTQRTPVKLVGDPMRLRQVCANLLVNAIKFTEKGQVLMRVDTDPSSHEAGMLRFCVADTGPGIAPEDQKRIFTRFVRTKSSVSGGQEGSGLGLEISRRLVEAMDGRIWVESVPDMGSAFYFTCRTDVQSAVEHDVAGNSRLGGTRVLVVDDNAMSRAVIGQMLSGAGASVSFCEAATHVIEELGRSHRQGLSYHVILLDEQMPPYRGIELAMDFDPSDRQRTIVMLTSDDFPRGPRAASRAGLGRHLMKPIKRADLLSAAASVAARTQAAAGKHAAMLRPSGGESFRALRILLAEDSEDNRLLIGAFLRGTPHKLDTAENGRVAVDMFETRSYDLVLIDLNMPVLDGYKAVAAMRAWEREQGVSPTPMVALTGRTMIEDRVRSVEAGCNAYLMKPIHRAVLMDAISRFTNVVSADLRL
jgi:two-component system, sensor histidine kinase and response regulator